MPPWQCQAPRETAKDFYLSNNRRQAEQLRICEHESSHFRVAQPSAKNEEWRGVRQMRNSHSNS